MVTPSNPIPMPAPSKPIAIGGRSDRHDNNDEDHPEFSSSDEESLGGRCGSSALSAALGAPGVGAGELRVGSLPMHLRRRGGSAGGGGAGSYLLHGSFSSGGRRFAGGGVATSLPHRPGAPYLSSREGPRDKLSSMPEVMLPESAAPTPSSSLRYGSLRESRFHYDHLRAGGGEDGATANFAGPRSFDVRSAMAGHPHGGNARDSGGIGALFDAGEGSPSDNGLSVGSIVGGWAPLGNNNSKRCGVEEIVDGCGKITFDGGKAPSGGIASCIFEVNEKIREPGLESSPPALSSSLTALDILTRAGDSRGVGADQSRGHIPSSGNGFTMRQDEPQRNEPWRNEPGQFQMHSGLVFPPVECSLQTLDVDDPHTNPDTFEAFDLDLDE